MSEVEKENEKDYKFFKIITLIIMYFVIGVIIVFAIGVSKVNAQSFTSGTINIVNSGGLVNGVGCSEFPCHVDNSANSNFGFQFILNNNTWASSSFNYVIQYKVYYIYTIGMIVNLNLNDITYKWVNGSSSTTNISSGCSTSGTQSVNQYSPAYYRKVYTLTTICSFISPPSNQTGFEIDVPLANVQYDLSTWRWGTRRGEFIGADRTAKGTSSITDSDRIIAQSDLNTQRIINSFNAGQQETQERIDENTDAVNQNTEAVEDINDSINDSSVDNPNNALNGLNNYFGSNGVISDLLLLPVRMFQSIVNTIDGTCSPFNLGQLLGHNLTMPCINLQSRLGNSLYSVIDILISGFFILTIRKKFVDIFNHFTSLNMGGNELE